MNATSQFILTLILSGVIAALVSAVMQKSNEKETRLFNAKLEAYTEFAAHLISRFNSLTRKGQDLDVMGLAEISAKCLLVSRKELNQKLKSLLVIADKVYHDKKATEEDFTELWDEAERIEAMMRKELGFK